MIRPLSALLLSLALSATAATSRRQLHFTVGTNTIAGLLELPARAAPHPVVLFLTDDGPLPKETFVTPSSTNAAQQEHHAIGLWDRFTRMGFGCFAWDKPGSGDSTGIWQADRAEARAAEIVAAIATLKQTPGIDPERIGLWCNSQAARALGQVLTGSNDVAFVVTISPPTRTPLERASEQLQRELTDRGIAAELGERAAGLLLRKWEMLRSGIPHAALSKYIAEERQILGSADHPWLAPFSPEEFDALTGPRRAELEAWFDAPFTRLLHLDIPVLVFLGVNDPAVTVNPVRHPHLNTLQFSDADHRMLRPDGSVTPSYWQALKAFFTARFPDATGRPPTAFKTSTFAVNDLTVELNFLDEATIAQELNLTDLTRRALAHYHGIFGGPPRSESGAPSTQVTINVDQGELSAKAGPARVDLTVGPQKSYGYLDWRVTFLHELAHLWIGESFAPASALEEWFNEGATEYLAIKTAIRFGIIPATAATDLLTRSWSNYLSARGIGEISLREAGHAGRQAHYFLIYHGGLTACMVLDYEIRRQTGNQSGFQNLLQLLHSQQDRDAARYDATAILRHLRALTGQDFTPFFHRHIQGKAVIPVGQHITRTEIEAIQTGQLAHLPELDRRIMEAIFETAGN